MQTAPGAPCWRGPGCSSRLLITFAYYLLQYWTQILHKKKKKSYTKALEKPPAQRKYPGGKLEEESSCAWCSGLVKDI